jgi:hypothetical protein
MARARNIKPGLYKNEFLADCSVWARYIFPGLWMIADRDGRLEDRPKRIKGEILPYDPIDVDPLLSELHDRGFIIRYSIDGRNYIQITNFGTHQNPHPREINSLIPECTYLGMDQATPRSDQGNEKDLSSPASSLNPSSLNPYKPKETTSLVASEKPLADILDINGKGKNLPFCPHEKIIAAYSEKLPELPHPRIWEGGRANNLRSRWKWVIADLKKKGNAHDEQAGLDFFGRMFAYIAKSDFLTGRDGKWQSCDLGWIVKAENFAKIIQGNYDNREAR